MTAKKTATRKKTAGETASANLTAKSGKHADWLAKAHVLTEALPFMQLYDKKTVVIKYGGHAMGNPDLSAAFARDVVLLKQAGINPVVVHGGGPQIAEMLQRLGMKSRFAGGLRVTDGKTMDVVEMVLAGSINKQIVTALNQAGGRAIGLSGKDGNLLIAKKTKVKTRDPDSNIEKAVDIGFTGVPEKVNPEVLFDLVNSDAVPVIAPVATSRTGQTFNVNADTAAGAIAAAMASERLLMLTDVAGVLDKKGNLIEHLTLRQANALIKNGTIVGGMIPKLGTAISARKNGVEAVAILDGRIPHAILLELFTALGAGTLIS